MKQKFIQLLLIVLMSASAVFAQNPSKVTIKGILQDTLHAPIPFATVMLLNPADSSLATFGSSNDKGEFVFSNVKNSNYLFKVSHMSFLPLQMMIKPSPTAINDLNAVEMKPLAAMLLEVVIKAAKAPLRIRGDTVEYDATTFKVPPGSSVEDLLRRLPGIEVDADGNISTQGNDVKRMYVDGKTFFGDDPKSVTKNLGAEAISKVQVYDEKSEQAKLTGVDDGSKEKAMNLELKEEYKKGSFGKLSLAGGTEQRLAARGNYNRFNNKVQFSVIGYGNNINQTGVNWEDYSEFKGNNSFNDFDNGDFGFNRYGRGFYIFNDDESVINNFDGRGLTKNAGAGTNLNYDYKGTKMNASYFFNQTILDYLQNSQRTTFIDSLSSFTKNDTLNYHDYRWAHTVGTRFEREFDSSNRLIIKVNLRYSGTSNTSDDNQQFSNTELVPYNSLLLNNNTGLDTYKITSAAIYRHLFRKKGRSFAISAGYNNIFSDGTDNYDSRNSFLLSSTPSEIIKQQIKKDKNIREIKSSALYTEPLSKRFYLEFFYNFSNLLNDYDRQAYPANQVNNIDSLSTYYVQETMYNRLGSVLRYSHNGINASIGLAAQQLSLLGKYAVDKSSDWSTLGVKKDYPNLTPNLSFNYEFKNNLRLEIGYTNNIAAPDFDDLQPTLVTSNPAYIVKGNPDLIPSNTHSINTAMYYWNQASFANVGFNIDAGITNDPIIYTQQSVFEEGKGIVNITRPVNMDQSRQIESWVWTNLPIIKTKLTLYFNGGLSFDESPASINSITDQSNTASARFGGGINLTPGTKLVLSTGFWENFTQAKYDLNNNFNQKYFNYSLYGSVKWQFVKRMFLESNFNYNYYRNKNYSFEQSIPLWNASVRRILGKNNKFELRLAAFDIFNKNVSLSQTAYANYIQKSTTNTLARYFMLSITYNMKGFESKLEKNRFW